jgi:hypothetical protein
MFKRSASVIQVNDVIPADSALKVCGPGADTYQGRRAL